MKKLLVMMIFGMFLFAASTSTNLMSLSLATNVYASDDNKDESKDEDKDEDKDESKDENKDDQSALSCPEDKDCYYNAIGEQIDVNNLPASAAGKPKPSRMRSF